jgi:hypothetical protein
MAVIANADGSQVHLFALFDGTVGDHAADYVSKSLLHNIIGNKASGPYQFCPAEQPAAVGVRVPTTACCSVPRLCTWGMLRCARCGVL